MDADERNELIKEIRELKKEREAVVLAHNYQRPEIYEASDFLGDSFDLAKKAAELKNVKRIIFCGVDFMAESAAILSPDKEVYLPSKAANCPMAQMAAAEDVIKMKTRYPDAAVACYVNSYAEVKAVSDVCVTSANAVKIVRALPHKEIIFTPDRNLGAYVARNAPEKKIILWEGFCYVHQRFTAKELKQAKKNNPAAEVIVHPECTGEVIDLSDHVCSTSRMIDVARDSKADTFIIMTEAGMVERLKRDVPGKKYLTPGNICLQMKKITLESVRDSLLYKRHRISVDAATADKARHALEEMLRLA